MTQGGGTARGPGTSAYLLTMGNGIDIAMTVARCLMAWIQYHCRGVAKALSPKRGGGLARVVLGLVLPEDFWGGTVAY